MTVPSFLAITLGLVAVFGVFWWLVEWTGGLAGSALSVCRSVSSGLDSWRVARPAPPVAASPIGSSTGGSSTGGPLVEDVEWSSDPAAEVTVEIARVHRDRPRRSRSRRPGHGS